MEMPYSGTSYDLLTGEAVEVTEGLRLKPNKKAKEQTETKNGHTRAEQALSDAVKNLNSLLAGKTLTEEQLLSLAEEVVAAAAKYQ